MVNHSRILWVDALRGIAIVLMIIFHFCYDLRYFGWVNWQVPNGHYWWPFRYIILSLFIFTLGISLHLAHAQRIQWRKFSLRMGQLALSAAAVSLMSLFLFRDTWIYFGILHFLCFASILSLPLLNKPRLSVLLGLCILLLYHLDILNNQWPFNSIRHWLPTHTEDYVPLFPWLAVSYLGLGCAQYLSLTTIERHLAAPPRLLIWLGQRGLRVYLLHQPLLFAVLGSIAYHLH
ncbi:MAG: DUF1624 domain-containing protein [Cellvibrionaceae bacterium]|nr:DUF1624 domain-containing protein [Cellvibrionaceae bacterium]